MAKKKYDELPEEEPMMVNEPTTTYGVAPSAEWVEYEEDMADSLSSEEMKKSMFEYIDKLFQE